ncbi:MAG: FRG domain-containing protein [Acidobacteria bacterium]|nr:FRG domain-containing protein [Acidobacteriota bacterium]
MLTMQPSPNYLFRGENGPYPTTVSSLRRLNTFQGLSASDRTRLQELSANLVWRFCEPDYGMTTDSAIGLLQHYGFPTNVVDFTHSLNVALGFAIAGPHEVGRICVLPMPRTPRANPLIDLSAHAWCERPIRQHAYGLLLPPQEYDLKSYHVIDALGLAWYEFRITEQLKECLKPYREDLLRIDDDPSAGFLRHHITEFVEATGKLSAALTDWLLQRVPVAPRCAEIREFDGKEVVVQHRALNSLPNPEQYDEHSERERTRRYWSTEFSDRSWSRMEAWPWPPVGTIYADPRTFHPVADA